jgi:hypothetical protein
MYEILHYNQMKQKKKKKKIVQFYIRPKWSPIKDNSIVDVTVNKFV